jgi:hypothetical protein
MDEVVIKRLKVVRDEGCRMNFLISRNDTGAGILGDRYRVWSTGNITDELVQEYLEYHVPVVFEI